MKTSHFTLFLTFGFFCLTNFHLAPHAQAQLSKEERKIWRKELRKLSPESLKNLLEKKEALESRFTLLSDENAALKTRTLKQENQIKSLKSDLGEVSERLKTLKVQLGMITDKGEIWDRGVVFKVQIGAYKEYDFSKMVGSGPDMGVEGYNGIKQYVVGNFRKYEDADVFKKHLRRLGVKNAWIVPYRNGRRVPLKDVLDYVVEQ